MFRQIFFPEENKAPRFSSKLLENYSSIVINPSIHNGWPYIKGTKILAADIFRSAIEGYSFEALLIELKGIGVRVTKRQLWEAFNFTLEWLYLHGKKVPQKTR